MNSQESTSTRPYLIRALHEWCTANGLTPHVAVRVDNSVQVPREYVKEGEIVLNLSLEATSALRLGNDFIEFTARFGGKPREIMIPIGRVTAIYARENGQGMAFPPPVDVLQGEVEMPPLDQPHAYAVPAADGNGADSERVVHLATGEPRAREAKETKEAKKPQGPVAEDTPPPRPPSGQSKKPALKRVK